MTEAKRPLTKDSRYSPQRARSVDEQIHGLMHRVTGPIIVTCFFLLFAALEWLRYYRPYRPEPLVYSAAAAIVLTAAAVRLLLLWPRLRALKFARDGERAVERFLDALRQRDYQIFDHVAGKGFDLDHVLIGPAGIFSVQIKRQSKASGAKREQIRVNGCTPTRDPIVHAHRQAHRLREALATSTEREFGVHPVILYAGCSVEWRGPKSRSIWVLSPEWLTSFLDHEPLRLSSDDIRLASFYLSGFAGAVSQRPAAG